MLKCKNENILGVDLYLYTFVFTFDLKFKYLSFNITPFYISMIVNNFSYWFMIQVLTWNSNVVCFSNGNKLIRNTIICLKLL